MPADRATSNKLGTGRARGWKMFVVMPCLGTSTPRSIDVWQGNVTLGITLRAVKQAVPSAIKRFIAGVFACIIPSGRIPSIENKITVCFVVIFVCSIASVHFLLSHFARACVIYVMSAKQADQPTAYLKVVSEESEIVNRQALSPGFHARYPAFFVSRYPDARHWPPEPDDPEAVQLMQQGQEALYQQNDTGMAIQCLKRALTRQPGYLKAWVALTVALIAENTEISLDDAERVLRNLLAYGDSIPQIARWMLHANFGTLWVHRSLIVKGTEQERVYLQRADEQYARAEALEEDEAHLATRAIRTYVKLGLGELEEARRFWNMLQENPDARLMIEEYEAKYPELKQLSAGGIFL